MKVLLQIKKPVRYYILKSQMSLFSGMSDTHPEKVTVHGKHKTFIATRHKKNAESPSLPFMAAKLPDKVKEAVPAPVKESTIKVAPIKSTSAPSPELSPGEDYKKNGVKSKAFKAWFGDWESGAGGTSKVVDKEGKPKENYKIPEVVYHGTPDGGFTEFDDTENRKSKYHEEDLLYGAGFYFTEDKSVAKEYQKKGDAHKTTYVTEASAAEIQKIVQLIAEDISETSEKAKGTGQKEFEPLYHRMQYLTRMAGTMENIVEMINDGNSPNNHLKFFKNAWKRGYNKDHPNDGLGLAKYVDMLKIRTKDRIYACYLNIKKPFDGDADRIPFSKQDKTPDEWAAYDKRSLDRALADSEGGLKYADYTFLFRKSGARKKLESLGYDGITHIGGNIMGTHEHRVWIAFNPTQIKSVENKGEFNSKDADIYKSIPKRYVVKVLLRKTK